MAAPLPLARSLMSQNDTPEQRVEAEQHEGFEQRLRELIEGFEADPAPDRDTLERFAEDALALLSTEERESLERAATAKRQPDRAFEIFGAIAELSNTQRPLVSLGDRNTELQEYLSLVDHVFGLWKSARDLYESGSYPLATFVAIATMEETGKVGIAKMQILFFNAGWRPSGDEQPQPRDMRSHRRKHFLVAGQGAFVNARLDRVLGLDVVAQFLDDAESGELERFRQACLYADRAKDGDLELPARVVQREDGLRYVVLAGELMAEVLGWEPQLWDDLLKAVNEFELRHGVVSDDSA
jgi:AbiV family abortive infection protein